ncbi:Ig-like domain-containing protein [Bacillus spizizenii ATCC 6633 = JCM 2499]|uniref:BIG2 domain-containing protein n=1 Tax=Bacillus spizizenii (strain ATCC 23059 / NRRL B-14472 / W23) TaxID=655816 RepID=E0TWU8_BACSH|nr:Ig-like domain-containing protein [Bacillus spizizenii]QCJ18924.1 Ig-like domain-containing protein [Bacillus subtilis]ADM39884.1 hypothetical protein BSUW23_19250 [Bacillus spizizenii str. W23]AJW85325.1 hypothetical protein BIS30_09180 [Bacillus spizizenii]EFG93699.1 hypothetical protein BSU6633_01734 [Bacillus spizizenii ATCC 6633 = JCM 2499]KFK77204.1 bacterial Ig-like domain family protein [Bacillus spizizenii]
MNVKKTVVSAISISALALSVSGVASAQEINASPVTDAKNITVSPSHIIKIQDYNLPLKVGETYSVKNSAATRYWSDNSSVASVDSNGIVKANAVGKANITLYKGTSVLGVVHVTVW